jgi:hypothetical protein
MSLEAGGRAGLSLRSRSIAQEDDVIFLPNYLSHLQWFVPKIEAAG